MLTVIRIPQQEADATLVKGSRRELSWRPAILVHREASRMFSVVRQHEARDRDAAEAAYRRGQEAYRRSAGAIIVNPFLPRTLFHKAFNLGVTEARETAPPAGNTSQPTPS
jgi:hypothetical protein